MQRTRKSKYIDQKAPSDSFWTENCSKTMCKISWRCWLMILWVQTPCSAADALKFSIWRRTSVSTANKHSNGQKKRTLKGFEVDYKILEAHWRFYRWTNSCLRLRGCLSVNLCNSRRQLFSRLHSAKDWIRSGLSFNLSVKTIKTWFFQNHSLL